MVGIVNSHRTIRMLGSLLASQGAWVHMPPSHWPLGSRGGALCAHWCARISSLRPGHEDLLGVSPWLRSISWLHKLAPAKNLFLSKSFLYINLYWGRHFSRGYQRTLIFSSKKKTFHLGVLSGRKIKPETNHPIFSAVQGVWIRSCYSFNMQ